MGCIEIDCVCICCEDPWINIASTVTTKFPGCMANTSLDMSYSVLHQVARDSFASVRNGSLDPHLLQSSPSILQHIIPGAAGALCVSSQRAGTPLGDMRGRDARLLDSVPKVFLEVFDR